jgi:hypothetical protein
MVYNFKEDKKMKNKFKYLVFTLLPFLIFVGCEDRTDLTAPPAPPAFSTGTANFSMYVSIGNSLTAGYQSNALSERDQVSSFPSLIAKQVQAPGTFEQPLIQNPGIGGRLKLLDLAPTIVAEPSVDPTNPASNLNIALQRPYNNLGIPGAILYDMTDVTDFTAKSVARQNPFFALILRNQALGNSVVNQARTLQATFVTAWIGYNDVLGYATSGGTSGTNTIIGPPRTLPTETAVFQPLYKAMLDALSQEPRGIVVGNIPSVSTIPFFTTVGPLLASEIPWGTFAKLGAPGIIYQSHNLPNYPGLPYAIGVADSASLIHLTTLFTLVGQTYAGLIGQPTGKFYRDNHFPALPAGVDTTKPFGVHPQNPFPDAYVLEPAEITIAETAVDAFNSIIASEAANKNIAVVDFNKVLKTLIATPIIDPGLGVFTSSFIEGGTFSYDGVHPSSRGYGIIANEWIKVINQKFGATIPLIDLSTLPAMPLGKASIQYINYAPGVFNNMVRMMTNNKTWPVNN